MSSGRIITVPVTIVDRNSEKVVKEASAQVRIYPDKAQLHLLAACEEGLFEARMSSAKVKRAKSNQELSAPDWLAIQNALFSSDVFEDAALPEKYQNAVLAGRLISLEQYDAETGDLIGEDLSDELPEFELQIKTEGVLSVTYGTFTLPFKSTEDLSRQERAEGDLLRWMLLMGKQIEQLRERLFSAERSLGVLKDVVGTKEREIEELTSDYQLIIRDLEDRFFQVVNSKRERIWELEGNDKDDLKHLNEKYLKKNETNLNRVTIEDIIIGDEDQRYALQKRKKAQKQSGRRKRVKELKIEEEDEEIKEEEDMKQESENEENEESEEKEEKESENEEKEGENEVVEVKEESDEDKVKGEDPEPVEEDKASAQSGLDEHTDYSDSDNHESADNTDYSD